MSNRLAGLARRGMRVLQYSLGGPRFILNGIEYPCVPSSERRGLEIEVGGLSATVELTLYVLQEDFPVGVKVDDETIFIDDESITIDGARS